MRTLATLLLALLGSPVWAQGIVFDHRPIRPPPTPPRPPRPAPIRLVEHRVDVRIEDQAARIEVVQVFHNPNPWQTEGVYLFPLPEGASVSRFTMRMGDKQVPGEILDAQRAREIYRSIVHRRRDPGLLEYAGRGLLRARLFPIPARGDVKITLSYEQLLSPVAGVLELRYPLRSDRFAPGPVKVAGRIAIASQAGIANVFSPSHRLDVVRKDERHAVASFEESASRADRDLTLLYTLGRKDFGLSLATHKPADGDGYFLMLIAPHAGLKPDRVMPKDIVFVIDTSGSMGDRGGKKMKQATSALAYALGRLDARDRFNVVSFATEARRFRERPARATPENVQAALEYVKGLEATGGTAIHDAMLAALGQLPADTGRVRLVLFLTDGQPTIGPTDPAVILRDVAKANEGPHARVFVFGVGQDVNTQLLTELADRNRGTGHYVDEGENIELKVSALYDKIASPVLSDVVLEVPGAGLHDVYPRRIGDLFKGQQVAVVGRYAHTGPRAVTLRGKLGGREVSYVYEATFADKSGRAYLTRLWAVRKVGFLLAEIRRHGEKTELVEEIRRLGTRHGIVTPYTSFLVLEERELLRSRLGFADSRGRPGAAGAPEPSEHARRALKEAERDLDAEGDAMNDAGESLRKREFVGKGAAAGARLEEKLRHDRGGAGEIVGVKQAGGKTFRLIDGVWVDTELEDFLAAHPEAPRRSVAWLSEAYDALLSDTALARCLSVGARVRLAWQGTVYEITAE